MIDRYYIQNVVRTIYSSGAVRHIYYKTHKCYVDCFEYEDFDMDPIRHERILQIQEQIIDELLKQYPPVVLFENGAWIHELPNEEIVYSFLDKFEDVGEVREDDQPVRIERVQVRKVL